MKDFIIRYWIEFVFGLIITGAGFLTRSYTKKIKKQFEQQSEEQGAVKGGMVALLRSGIVDTYNRYKDKGYCPIYALENVHELYIQYSKLGGNGTATKLVEELEDMPHKKPNI